MWSLYLSFKGFKLPWSFPTHNPSPFLSLRLSVPPSLSQSLSLSVSLSLSMSISLSPFLCWDPVGLTFYNSLVHSQLSLTVSIPSPLWPLTST